jgi:hypothetical protein
LVIEATTKLKKNEDLKPDESINNIVDESRVNFIKSIGLNGKDHIKLSLS